MQEEKNTVNQSFYEIILNESKKQIVLLVIIIIGFAVSFYQINELKQMLNKANNEISVIKYYANRALYYSELAYNEAENASSLAGEAADNSSYCD